jgi:hypothetical protein
MRCEYAHDDGAYVLGALSPSERAAYERHLADCSSCREAVAEIAVLPGLLGRLDPAAARQLLGPMTAGDAPDATDGPTRPIPVAGGDARVVSLVETAAKSRRREKQNRRFRYAGTALVAACLALVAALGVGMLNRPVADNDALPPSPPPPTRTATPPAPVQLYDMKPHDAGHPPPVVAQIGLTPRDWGTEVTMKCRYKQVGEYKDAWTFRLVAVGPDHMKEELGSWLAGPGDSLSFAVPTRFANRQLTRLEITQANGNPLLYYDVM